MKKIKFFIAVALILTIGLSLLACGKVNLQTEQDVIEYLENYIEEEDRWGEVADELGLYYSLTSSYKFNSTSFAQKDGDDWVVVIHGAISGYKDYNKTNLGKYAFSYVATVTADGQVSENFITEGQVTKLQKSN